MKPLIKRFQVLVNVGLLQQHRSAVFVNQKHQITNGCSVLMTPIVELDDENKLKCSIIPIGGLISLKKFQVWVDEQTGFKENCLFQDGEKISIDFEQVPDENFVVDFEITFPIRITKTDRPSWCSELLNDAGTSDFQVVVANQGEMQTIPVHKAIIRKFSKRIDRILANPGSVENATNQIVIENFTFDVVSKSLDVGYSRTLLSFKNGEEINYNMLDMLNLYWFFKEYEMIDIDLICNWIESNMSLQNIVFFLLQFQMRNENVMLDLCKSFIRQNWMIIGDALAFNSIPHQILLDCAPKHNP